MNGLDCAKFITFACPSFAPHQLVPHLPSFLSSSSFPSFRTNPNGPIHTVNGQVKPSYSFEVSSLCFHPSDGGGQNGKGGATGKCAELAYKMDPKKTPKNGVQPRQKGPKTKGPTANKKAKGKAENTEGEREPAAQTPTHAMEWKKAKRKEEGREIGWDGAKWGCE
jgi:hypothetical protein